MLLPKVVVGYFSGLPAFRLMERQLSSQDSSFYLPRNEYVPAGFVVDSGSIESNLVLSDDEMSHSIEAFVENVRNYCELIESDRHDVVAIRQTLLALMQGVPLLITNNADDCGDVEFPRRGYDGWSTDVARLADLPIQYYRKVFDPLDVTIERAVVGNVCDDLADIYGELWHGLQAHDAGATSYAVNHWRYSYSNHWGHHAVGAVSAFDAYTRKDVI